MMEGFSVLMSVYDKENPAYLKESIESVLNQTLKANEIVIVKDGILNEKLEEILDGYEEKKSIRTIQLYENVGLGKALSIGIGKCSYELIARMDSDDICEPHRFEKQLRYMEEHPETAVCGGQIAEFIDHKEAVVGKRIVPIEHEDIVRYARRRNPVNHMSVIFRKKAVQEAGSYVTLLYFEDYELWLRMISKGYKFHNLNEVLVYVRTDEGFQKRRGGIRYFKKTLMAQKKFLENGYISYWDFFINVLTRGMICLVPPTLRRRIYIKYLRRK